MATISIQWPDALLDELLDAHAKHGSNTTGLSKLQALENTLVETCRSFLRIDRAENSRRVTMDKVNDDVPLPNKVVVEESATPPPSPAQPTRTR